MTQKQIDAGRAYDRFAGPEQEEGDDVEEDEDAREAELTIAA